MIRAVRTIYRDCRRTIGAAVRPLLQSRRLDVSCCGLSKTGTHSMAGIFQNYRCQHHPGANVRLPLAVAYLNNQTREDEARSILKNQDRSMWLEVESSSLAGVLIRPLVEACPDKKFILTMRDVYSWFDSWLDHNINSPPNISSPWAKLDLVRLRVKDFSPTTYDEPLTEQGFPPLACYFQLWASHNEQVLKSVPSDRLLIVKTQDIVAMVPSIASWLGIHADTLDSSRGWLFVAPERHGTLAKLDSAYVRETAEAHCGDLMQQYFPDTTLESVVARRCVTPRSLS